MTDVQAAHKAWKEAEDALNVIEREYRAKQRELEAHYRTRLSDAREKAYGLQQKYLAAKGQDLPELF